MKLIFDGTFDGFLSSLFVTFQDKLKQVQLIPEYAYQADLLDMLDEVRMVVTEPEQVKRVWDGLEKKLSKKTRTLFKTAFHCEDPAIFQQMFDFACEAFTSPRNLDSDFSNPRRVLLDLYNKKVRREKHRMEAFIRFEKDANGLYTAIIDPDFNVLPLIIPFFRRRYSDQRWLIYDVKRKFGAYYDLTTVSEVSLQPEEPVLDQADQDALTVAMDEKEALYNTLWKDYFTSTNIVERKNMKLHIRHVPKRYWKYLTEKK